MFNSAVLIATLIVRATSIVALVEELMSVTCDLRDKGPFYIKESMPTDSIINETKIVCRGPLTDPFNLRFKAELETVACSQFSFSIKDMKCNFPVDYKKECIYTMNITVKVKQLDYERAELRECRRELIASKWADSAIVRVIVENEVCDCTVYIVRI